MADDLDGDDLEIERTQAGARQALIAAAGKHDLDEFASVPRYCDEDVLGQVIALAWRHQFDDSRASFKRNIAELQAYVAGRIKLSANEDGG
jgi:hypothetical protein